LFIINVAPALQIKDVSDIRHIFTGVYMFASMS